MKPTRVLAALVAALIPIIGVTTPAAHAHHTCWIDGADMPTTTDVSCRDSFVLDPGYGRVLSHEDIIRHRDYYQARGFHPNFIWYARIENRPVVSGDVEWSGCDDNNRVVDVPCAPHLLHFKPVWNPFHARPVTLPSLSYGDSFIGQACGNFSRDTSAKPVPLISGHKYHDANRNGVRDAGEPGLAGWTMTLHRDRSDAGQGTGAVDTRTTDANGYYEFRLDGHLPGDYAVTEENRADWTRTSGTERHGVHVPIGAAGTKYEGHDFGNVETKADAVKVAFEFIDPPAEMTADTPHLLRIRALLENRGPAPVIEVGDWLQALDLPPDCSVMYMTSPAPTRQLVIGRPVEVIFEVEVSCSQPSFHRFAYSNTLVILTPGVTDPDDSSNFRTTETTIAVIDEANVGIDDTRLDCASRTYVRDQFECTVTAVAVNLGDHGPANTDVNLGLTGPADCTLTPTTATSHEVSITSPATVSSKWDVTCANRSYHDFTASAQAVLDHLHVIDPDPANNTGSAADRVEVFERTDLSVTDIRLTCTERQYRTQDFACTTTTTVANAGPADAVHTLTTVTFSAPADCTISPNTGQQQAHVLNAGTTATFTKDWAVSCSQDRRHLLSTTAVIAADEPHPEDTDRANDVRSIDWVPPDVKPRSFPSSINVKKDGLIPVAILSTAEFDAVAQVDRTSLTFGATGLEQSLVRCGSPGEDVNDDGRADLVCQFDATKTGLTCGMTSATLVGSTVDGRRFEGQDDIKLTGC
ncbi:SdrD B-like domain-containing protein [Lentzea sp. BCCO 10_0856]|uniref:SdrD B-like domain-containing protein n=1 Tax=Lentzea miocenica TaxID=3095431 RepID=A0ABU4TDD6_9PSEU|nr:SdrD B-like domain-containing protein [Lentzea sp. BCCO 10_0856]MDX8036193.1 SdrD B-like domain-containing protein [Lentzea sp. BCCO 10_0856]